MLICLCLHSWPMFMIVLESLGKEEGFKKKKKWLSGSALYWNNILGYPLKRLSIMNLGATVVEYQVGWLTVRLSPAEICQNSEVECAFSSNPPLPLLYYQQTYFTGKLNCQYSPAGNPKTSRQWKGSTYKHWELCLK